MKVAASANRSSRRPTSASRPSADLAGTSVALSIDVPAVFDAPLAPHHKLIGRWVAAREDAAKRYNRQGAREAIEAAFGAAIADILGKFELVELGVMVLAGEGDLPPAVAVICESIGQIDLGWIQKSNMLSDTLFANVAPVGWRAAAYRAIGETLGAVLPFFGYDDLLEELSGYYWDGGTDDAGALMAMRDWHGLTEEEANETVLPSQIAARRPDWMTAKAAPLKDMPPILRDALRRLRDAHKAVQAASADGSAWRVNRDELYELIGGRYEDCSHLPPLTIVPFDQFARELDDVCRFGMEQGFDDVCGLCALRDVESIDRWFASLRLGAEYLLALQALINLDPANPVKP